MPLYKWNLSVKDKDANVQIHFRSKTMVSWKNKAKSYLMSFGVIWTIENRQFLVSKKWKSCKIWSVLKHILFFEKSTPTFMKI